MHLLLFIFISLFIFLLAKIGDSAFCWNNLHSELFYWLDDHQSASFNSTKMLRYNGHVSKIGTIPLYYWNSPSHAQPRKILIWCIIQVSGYTCYHETWSAVTICYSVGDGGWKILYVKKTHVTAWSQLPSFKSTAFWSFYFGHDTEGWVVWGFFYVCISLSFILCNGRSWTACWLKSGILWDDMIWAEAPKASRGLLLLSLLSSYVLLSVCTAYCIWTLKSHCSLSPSVSLYLSPRFLSLFSPLCSRLLLMHLRSMNGFL